MDIVEILKAALRTGASDVHLAAGSAPLARVSGELAELPGFGALSPETCRALVYSALSERQRAAFEADLELDASFNVPGVSRFRMNVLLHLGAVEAVFRVIPLSIPTPEGLGLGPTVMSLVEQPHGLVLVTGPTGSGKTSTLACMIQQINRTRRRHVITIEDPVEYVYPRGKSLIRQREVGADTRSFKDALRHALREDPDVILVGEMRDLETIALALTAAETGHLCLSTLHTIDAAQTVDRIIDVFPADQQAQVRVQLAGSLRGVVSQVLLRRLDGAGRIAARGLMTVTPAIAALIRGGKTHMIANAIETSGAEGMFTMQRAVKELARRGLIEAPRHAAALEAGIAP